MARMEDQIRPENGGHSPRGRSDGTAEEPHRHGEEIAGGGRATLGALAGSLGAAPVRVLLGELGVRDDAMASDLASLSSGDGAHALVRRTNHLTIVTAPDGARAIVDAIFECAGVGEGGGGGAEERQQCPAVTTGEADGTPTGTPARSALNPAPSRWCLR